MNGHSAAGVGRRCGAVVFAVVASSTLAAPTTQADRGPSLEIAAPSADDPPAAVADPRGDSHAAASAQRRLDQAALAPDDASAAAPVTRAMLPRQAASAVPVEEDPRVGTADVVESVARATLSAVPWLHLGPRPRDDAARRGDATQADLALRLEADAANRSGGGSGNAADGRRKPGGPGLNLLGEALELARDFVADPLTWIVGIPLLLGAFMLAVLRGREK